jgi:hypothetical protein
LDVKEEPEFLHIKHDVWQLLSGEARKAMAE